MLSQYKISKRYRLDDPYVCAGDRVYLIGTQDGLFPDMGGHVPNEMGGLWDHPIKLADGFWAVFQNGQQKKLLDKAVVYTSYPFHQEFVYDLREMGFVIKRKHFCPDGIEGIVIEYDIENKTSIEQEISFEFLLRTDLSPVWLSERLNVEDGVDLLDYKEDIDGFIGKDEINPWYIVWGSEGKPHSWEIPKSFEELDNTAGKGANGRLIFNNIKVTSKSTYTFRFFVSGSYASEEMALRDFAVLKEKHEELFQKKLRRYEALIREGNMRVPDEAVNTAIDWLKFNYDWLIRYVPEIGNGLGAGFPEYIWWFGCDNGYALLGLLPTGRFDIIEDTLRLLKNVSEKENGNGRIIHEASTNGVVYNPGNTQETAQFIKLVWQVFQWTGNEAFLKEMFPFILKSMHWLLEEMDKDKDLFPEGYGIIEIAGLNCESIDTAVFTQRAIEAFAEMLEYLAAADSKPWREKAELLKEKINKEYWREEDGVFGDFIAKPEQVLERYEVFRERGLEHGDEEFLALADALMEQALHAEVGKDTTFNMKNWVINLPMEEGIADIEKAHKALDTMEKNDYTGRFGLKLGATKKSPMMTISTAAQAEAEGQYGRVDQLLGYIHQIISTFSIRVPGTFSEMSPDYGCFMQSWTGYGVIWPIVSYIFGIRPNAAKKEIVFTPRVPFGWSHWEYRDVKIGSAVFNFSFEKREDGKKEFTIETTAVGWKIIIMLDDTHDSIGTVDGDKQR